jgi:hypothetical protein
MQGYVECSGVKKWRLTDKGVEYMIARYNRISIAMSKCPEDVTQVTQSEIEQYDA